MNTPTLPEPNLRRLQSHFGFTKVPFRKNMFAREMFDSRSQREVLFGLALWAGVHGLALLEGKPGVGKSITIRRFLQDLDEQRYRVVHLTSHPTTPMGFLRSLSRALGLPMRAHAADLFDAAQKHLVEKNEDQAPHPLLVLDDAEGMSAEVLDLVRRLTAWSLDAEDRFSVLVCGTDQLLRTLRHPVLEPLCSRFSYARTLQSFTMEDTRNYILFHIQRADSRPDLFSDDAVRRVFQASQGCPRNINQVALQALVEAAVQGIDKITGDFVGSVIANHPLYRTQQGS
jgi:type II secretory pathway predicted ATPase ExeA